MAPCILGLLSAAALAGMVIVTPIGILWRVLNHRRQRLAEAMQEGASSHYTSATSIAPSETTTYYSLDAETPPTNGRPPTRTRRTRILAAKVTTVASACILLTGLTWWTTTCYTLVVAAPEQTSRCLCTISFYCAGGIRHKDEYDVIFQCA